MITAVTRLAGGLSGSTSVVSLQQHLRAMGMQVRPTGVLDKATVAAINAVFTGWDDAPPKLATGRLTAHQISMQLPVVAKLVSLAAHGAMTIPAG